MQLDSAVKAQKDLVAPNCGTDKPYSLKGSVAQSIMAGIAEAVWPQRKRVPQWYR